MDDDFLLDEKRERWMNGEYCDPNDPDFAEFDREFEALLDELPEFLPELMACTCTSVDLEESAEIASQHTIENGGNESEAHPPEEHGDSSLVSKQVAISKSNSTVRPHADMRAPAYPAMPLEAGCTSQSSLEEALVKIAVSFRRDQNYAVIRDEFVRVSLALNQLGLLAPAFRDQPRIPYDRKLWSKCTQLLIDLIVIDCHWLFCRGERVSPRWAELKGVFDHATPFDCALIAEQVGAKNWTPDFRVDELIRLSRRQQLQLVQLRGEAVRQSFRVVLDGGRAFEDGKAKRIRPLIADVRAKITDWADRNHRVQGHEMMYESLWLASALLGGDASVRDIGELAALRCGRRPLDRKTVEGKLKVLRNVLGSDGDARQAGATD